MLQLCCTAALLLQAAVKLINSALQKHSKHQMLRVLKAVALQRSGKLDEALQVTSHLWGYGCCLKTLSVQYHCVVYSSVRK